MEYIVYTFGGGEVLWKILNALALLFANDSEYFTPVLKLSAGIGAIWAAVRAIYQTNIGIFGKSWFVPTYIALSVLFIPKASLGIVDKVDPSFVARKVDNLPLGLVAIAGSTSSFCYELTMLIEKHMGNENANLKYSTTGPMFAAKLVAMSRDIRIADPTQRQNVKDFCKQCFMWPYVFSNIEPGTTSALKSKDILKFVESNPHPGLGIYWRDTGGLSEFKSCKDCVPKVRALMLIENKKPFAELVKQFWSSDNSPIDESGLSSKMQSYAKSGWEHIGIDSQSSYELTGQQMIINAYRESLDDQREAAGAVRIHPRLIANSSIRGREQQNAGFLVGGAMAAEYLPSTQSVLFGLLLMLFTFVVPCSLMPGGIKILGLWIKAIFWVQSWPIFYSVLHAIGMMFYAKSTQSVMLGNGEGLTLLTYSGLSDVAWNSYCAVQNMFLTIPVLSWGILSGGGYAITQIASSLTPNQGASLGAGIADGNQTFDTQSFHNRTMQSYQIGQQQLRPGINTSSSLNDGNFNKVTGEGGSSVFHENLSNIGSNFNWQSVLSSSANQSFAQSQQNVDSLSTRLSDSKMETLTQAQNLAQNFTHNDALNQSFSGEENRSFSESASKTLSAINKFANNDQLSNTTSSELNGGVSGEFGFGKLFKVSAGGKLTRSALDTNTLQQLKEAGVSEQDLNTFTKGFNARVSTAASSQDSQTASLANSYNTSAGQTLSLAKEHSSALSNHQSISNTKSFIDSQSANWSVNMNDRVLEEFGKEHYGNQYPDSYKEMAVRFQRDHRDQYLKMAMPIANQMIANEARSFNPSNQYKSSSSAISDNYNNQSNAFSKKGEAQINQGSVDHGVSKKDQEDFFINKNNKVIDIQNRSQQEIPRTNKIQEQREKLQADHQSRKDKLTIGRAAVGDKSII